MTTVSYTNPSPISVAKSDFYSYYIFLASCSVVRSFEVIVSAFAQQLQDGERFSFMTENILFVAELVSLVA